MIETRFDIHFSADAAPADVASNTSGLAEQEAELVTFAHYALRILRLPDTESRDVIEYLSGVGKGAAPSRPEERGTGRDARVVARFVDARGGPRMLFRMKATDGHGVPALHAVVTALSAKWGSDRAYLRSLADTAAAIGRVGARGQIGGKSEFDLALAAADVAWDPTRRSPGELVASCPACNNSSKFEFRLWPSEGAAIRRCGRCGAGVWLRRRRRPRLIAQATWRALEALRRELGAEHSPAGATVDGALLESLKRAFAENGWPFSEVQGVPALLSELSGPHGSWAFYAQAVEELDLILLYSVCPLTVPGERRDEMARLLTRANYGLAAGNFELDFADGEVRYKTTLHLHGNGLDPAALKRLVRANGVAMETYLPGIGAVIEGEPAASALHDP